MCNFIACKTAKIKICSSKLTFQLSSLGVHKVSMVSPTLFIRSPRKCSDIRSATQPLSHSAHSIWMQMHGARCTARLVAPHTHTQLLWLLHSFFVVVDAFACNTFLGAGWKAKEYASQVDCFPAVAWSCRTVNIGREQKLKMHLLAVLRMDSAAGGRARVEP